MNVKQFDSKWKRLRELLVTTPVGWIPTITLGVVIRNLLYRTIFKRMGTSIFIQDGAEFVSSSIEIGDRVYIFRGVRLTDEARTVGFVLEIKLSLSVALISPPVKTAVLKW